MEDYNNVDFLNVLIKDMAARLTTFRQDPDLVSAFCKDALTPSIRINHIADIRYSMQQKLARAVFNVFMGPPKGEDSNYVKIQETGWARA